MSISPDEALARLKAGNKRYVDGVAKRHDFVAEREALVGGQNPFAGILSCADSRIAPEYAFDTSRGDLFVVRVAGNFVNVDNLASFEYAVAVLNTPLIMVLGHEACGAVKAAISAVKDKATFPGHIQDLTTSLSPAVRSGSRQDRRSSRERDGRKCPPQRRRAETATRFLMLQSRTKARRRRRHL